MMRCVMSDTLATQRSPKRDGCSICSHSLIRHKTAASTVARRISFLKSLLSFLCVACCFQNVAGVSELRRRLQTSAPIPSTAAPTKRPTLAPTRVPTRIPTRPPTPMPTHQPTEEPTFVPTKQPTEQPTEQPTRRPTPRPTENPTRSPTDTPTLRPTSNPTLFPTSVPTFGPTISPSSAPSDSPSLLPSDSPSLLPSGSPSVTPTARPSSSPTISTQPTTFTHHPTLSAQPSPQPSDAPSQLPSVSPSNEPSSEPSSGPTLFPTVTPTLSPTLPELEKDVKIEVRMESINGTLQGVAAITWERLTSAHIQRSISTNDVNSSLVSLSIVANIEGQRQLISEGDGQRYLALTEPDTNGARFLQEKFVAPLLVSCFVTITYRSPVPDWDWPMLVGEAFNSDAERQTYVDLFETRNPDVYGPFTSVSLLVDGVAPIEEPEVPPSSSSNNTLYAIIGGVVGGAAVLAGLGLLYRRHRRQKSKNYGEGGPGTTSASTKQPLGYSTEILVERQDDISTLGDPVGIVLPGTMLDRDEQTASVNDYDYTQEYLERQGIAVDNRERFTSIDSGRGSTNSTSVPKVGNVNLADDASFEEQFLDGPEERLEVDVPAGKLGMVIDTPDGGVPVVHAIKLESVLADRVQVGDRLISVDDQDVTKMSAVQVSKLISLKSDQDRVLAFLRSRQRDAPY